jgi:hypothetical protein
MLTFEKMHFRQFKAIVVDKLKRLRAVPFGTSDPSGDGWPRGIDRAGALKYFEDKYEGPTIPVVTSLLKLHGKRVISIGSGFGGEEMRIAMLGDNEVHCIEPDEASCKFHAECQRRFGNVNVILHNMTLNGFREHYGPRYHEVFDVIYSSSPGDWMRGDFREILPEAYSDFLNHFGAPESVVIFKLYGGSHDPFVLRSSWFARALINSFAEKTKYRVRAYWTTERRAALVVASTEPNRLPPMPVEMPLSETTARLRYPSAGLSLEPKAYDGLIPYVIAGEKILAFVNGQLRKPVRKLTQLLTAGLS